MPDPSSFGALAKALSAVWPSARARLLKRAIGAAPDTRDRFSGMLRWAQGPQAQAAFAEAVGTAVQQFERAEQDQPHSFAIAHALAQTIRDAPGTATPHDILSPAFDFSVTLGGLQAEVSARLSPAQFADADTITETLRRFYVEHLGPAVRQHPHFADHALLADILGALQNDRSGRHAVPSDAELDALERDYRAREAETTRLMVTRGLSLRLKNELVGVSLRDVFVPLQFAVDERAPQPLRSIKIHGFGHSGGFLKDLVQSGQTGVLPSLDLGMRGGRGNTAESVYVDAWLNTLFAPPSESVGMLLARRRVVVQGDPGSGKSTFAQFVVHAAATGDAEAIGESAAACLPIRARAAAFGDALASDPGRPFETFLLSREPSYRLALDRALLSGRALVVVDGLDEVADPTLRHLVKEAVERFMADPLYADNHLVVTTRLVGYQRDGAVGALSHATLQPFSDDQIERCVAAWTRALANASPSLDLDRHAAALVQAIHESDGVLRLARNPLLLTVIVLLHWQGHALPANRARLYDVAVGTLLSTWPSAQRGVRLDEHFLREWLAPVARHVFSAGEADVVGEAELKRLLVSSMEGLRSVTPVEARMETDALLRLVEEHTGLLVPKGADADGRTLYGFSHQTFAEFLTALDLAGDLAEDALDLVPVVRDPYWREVLLLLAGHLGNDNRKRAGRLVQRVRAVDGASRQDALLHTGTFRAAEILADGVFVGPPSVTEPIYADLVELFLRSPLLATQQAARRALVEVSRTEYGAPLARAGFALCHGDSGDVLRVAAATLPAVLADPLRAIFHQTAADVEDWDSAQSRSLRNHAAVLLLDIDPDARAHLESLVATGGLDARTLAVEALAAAHPEVARVLVERALAEAQGDALVTPWLAFQRSHPDLVAARLFKALQTETLLPDLVRWLVYSLDDIPEAKRPQLAEVVAAASQRPQDLAAVAEALVGAHGMATHRDAEALRDAEDIHVRWGVAIAYLRSGIDQDSDIDDWAWQQARDALENGTTEERLAAGALLHAMDPDVVAHALEHLLHAENAETRRASAAIVGPASAAARAVWWEAIQEGGSRTSDAAYRLWSAPEERERLVAALRADAAGAASEDPAVQHRAAGALEAWVGMEHLDAWYALDEALGIVRTTGRTASVPVDAVHEALASSRFTGVAQALAAYLDSPVLRPVLVAAFGRMGNRDAHDVLRERAEELLAHLSLDDPDHHGALNALVRVLSADDLPPARDDDDE